MSRLTTEAVTDALELDHTAFPLVELYFDEGTMYLAGAPHDVDWNGHTYLAAQGIASIEPIKETSNGAAGIAFTMPLVSQAAINSAMNTPIQGRRVIIRGAVIIDGEVNATDILWDGTLDVATLNIGSGQDVVRVTSEHDMINWNRPHGRLMSHAEQQKRHPGDFGFEYAGDGGDVTISWPNKSFYQR